MLTVIEPADSQDLATLDAVKTALGITGSSEDGTLRPLISAASAAIAKACNRVLVRETVEQAFRSSGGRRGLMLARYPVSVDAVTENGVALEADSYEVDAASGLVERLISGRPACWSCGAIIVTYEAGFEPDEVPPDIVQAVIMLVAQYRSQASRDPMLRVEETTDIERLEYFPTTAAGLPAPVTTLIDPHRKRAGS